MRCPIHEVNYTFVCPYCQAAKIAELENEQATSTDVRTRGRPWAHDAMFTLKCLEEFEEAEKNFRRNLE